MEALNIRKAHESDSEFVFTVKKAAFQEYVEQVWGWDDSYQRDLHNRRFTSQDFTLFSFVGQMSVSWQLLVVPIHSRLINSIFCLNTKEKASVRHV